MLVAFVGLLHLKSALLEAARLSLKLSSFNGEARSAENAENAPNLNELASAISPL
jgi:hypothetical protein